MQTESVQAEFLTALTVQYELDPTQFVIIPKSMLDCSSARVVIAELRNAGEIEEQIRGVVRLTARGYKLHRNRGAYAHCLG
jgi:hypothetical protein